MFLFLYIHLLACSEKTVQSCEYEGKDYTVGESFPAGDGCNTCSCEEVDGELLLSCTEIGCMDSDPTECSMQEIDSCENIEGCTISYASPIAFIEDNECYVWANEIEAVGCISAELVCTGELKHGASLEDPNTCYGFGGCMPEGWGDCGLGDYPECPQIDSKVTIQFE